MSDRLDSLEAELARLGSIIERIAHDVNVIRRTTADDVLTTREAAEMLGCSEWSLHHLRLQGRGPEFIQAQKGGSVRYRRSALEEWQRERGVA